jgi:hypothetical protein
MAGSSRIEFALICPTIQSKINTVVKNYILKSRGIEILSENFNDESAIRFIENGWNATQGTNYKSIEDFNNGEPYLKFVEANN